VLDFLHDALFTVQMILSVILATSSELQTLAAMASVAFVSSVIAWWLQLQKIRLLKIRHGEETAGWQAQLASQKEESLKLAAQAQKHLDEALAERAVVEQRFALHREAAQRRENDSLARIGLLETDLAATREIAAKLPHVQARIGDLETAISSERGRVGALEQTLQVTNTRAQELSAQLQETLARSAAFEEKTQAREAELVQQLADREQSLASDQARLGTVDDEITRLKDAQIAYQTTAESRIAAPTRRSRSQVCHGAERIHECCRSSSRVCA
jgi:chromosome segregation ATPase